MSKVNLSGMNMFENDDGWLMIPDSRAVAPVCELVLFANGATHVLRFAYRAEAERFMNDMLVSGQAILSDGAVVDRLSLDRAPLINVVVHDDGRVIGAHYDTSASSVIPANVPVTVTGLTTHVGPATLHGGPTLSVTATGTNLAFNFSGVDVTTLAAPAPDANLSVAIVDDLGNVIGQISPPVASGTIYGVSAAAGNRNYLVKVISYAGVKGVSQIGLALQPVSSPLFTAVSGTQANQSSASVTFTPHSSGVGVAVSLTDTTGTRVFGTLTNPTLAYTSGVPLTVQVPLNGPDFPMNGDQVISNALFLFPDGTTTGVKVPSSTSLVWSNTTPITINGLITHVGPSVSGTGASLSIVAVANQLQFTWSGVDVTTAVDPNSANQNILIRDALGNNVAAAQSTASGSVTAPIPAGSPSGLMTYNLVVSSAMGAVGPVQALIVFNQDSRHPLSAFSSSQFSPSAIAMSFTPLVALDSFDIFVGPGGSGTYGSVSMSGPFPANTPISFHVPTDSYQKQPVNGETIPVNAQYVPSNADGIKFVNNYIQTVAWTTTPGLYVDVTAPASPVFFWNGLDFTTPTTAGAPNTWLVKDTTGQHQLVMGFSQVSGDGGGVLSWATTPRLFVTGDAGQGQPYPLLVPGTYTFEVFAITRTSGDPDNSQFVAGPSQGSVTFTVA